MNIFLYPEHFETGNKTSGHELITTLFAELTPYRVHRIAFETIYSHQGFSTRGAEFCIFDDRGTAEGTDQLLSFDWLGLFNCNIFLDVSARFSKFSNALTESLGDFRYFLGSEEEHDNKNNQQPFKWIKFSHFLPFCFIEIPLRVP